jgi:hypothetical protein
MENVLLAAFSAGLNLSLAQLVTDAYRGLVQAVPHADQSAILLVLERLNPGMRVGTDTDHLP